MTVERSPLSVDREKQCPNPFCDGTGWIDISPSINGKAWAPACKVGPHPADVPPRPAYAKAGSR